MSADYYEILAITQSATQDQVRRAYFKMVRKHPPEKDPETFKQIRKAYDTLSDPKARKLYDDRLNHGDEIIDLYTKAGAYMDEESYSDAIQTLKKILVLSSGEYSAGNMLGLCYLDLKDYQNAIKTYNSLTKKAPDVPLFWYNYGMAYFGQARSLSETHSGRPALLKSARVQFRKAAELEPLNQMPYQAIAETYIEEKNFYQAEIWVEKAIGADSKVDIDDLESMFKLCMIYLLSNRIEKVEKVAQRIQTFVPEDEDAKKYVAYRFVEFAQMLAKIEVYDYALEFVKTALKFDPKNSELKKWKESLITAINVPIEYERFKDDYRIVEPLRRLITIYYIDFCGQSHLIDGNRDAIVKDIFRQFEYCKIDDIISSLTRIKNSYKSLYNLNEETMQHLEKIALKSRSNLQSSGQQPSSSSSSNGGCFVVTATFGTPQAPIVSRYRTFRDKHLQKSRTGRVLIRIYRKIGPVGAAILNRFPALKKPMAAMLNVLAKHLPEN